jgi:hypothetical protein
MFQVEKVDIHFEPELQEMLYEQLHMLHLDITDSLGLE